MEIIRGIKYRIYPTEEQEAALAVVFGQSRWVYNHYLQVRKAHYRIKGKGIGYNQTAGMLVRLKKTKGFCWLQEASSQVLQQSLRDLDKAYQKFFKEKKGYPKFKSKRDKQSVRYPNQVVEIITRGDKKASIRLAKIGEIRLVMHKPLDGEIQNVTITKTKSGRYYASVCMTCEIEPMVDKPEREVGIDVGLTSFIVTSEGEKIAPPKYLEQSEKRLKRLQRRLSRRVKGSNNREKARLALARLHEKVSAQRADFSHQLSTRLTRSCTLIAIEDLNVRGMTTNHHLAKSISDAAWSAFFRQLAYKGVWSGCEIRQIGRFDPSSKSCSNCGFITPDLPLSVREWVCPSCGDWHDRDINAAANILLFSRGRLSPKVTPAKNGKPLLFPAGTFVETGIVTSLVADLSSPTIQYE